MRVHKFGSGKPRVVLLHGFTQQGGHMQEAARLIGHSSIAPDLPGHGSEPHLPATMEEAVARVVELCDGVEALIGYSMGGRIALRAAPHLPDLQVLVLVSATAGLAEIDRPARLASDEALARCFETEPLPTVIDDWLAKPLFEGATHRSEEWRERDRSLRLEGVPSALAESLRGMGQGAITQVPDESLAALQMDVECVAGRTDTRYTREAERMASLIPVGVARIHPTAGHAVLAEDPGFAVRNVRVRLP